MFFLPFWTLITWLVLGGFELAPTLITNVDWMMCFLCTHLTYRVLQELPRKRETLDWLKARFKLLCFLTPILHYFHILGLPLEQIVMIDWLGMLCMLIYWYHSYSERYMPRQALWHPTRLQFYGYFKSFKKSRLKRRRTRQSILHLLAYATVLSKHFHVTAYASTASGQLLHLFDSDSKPWLINNCLTACLVTNNKGNFVGKLHTASEHSREGHWRSYDGYAKGDSQMVHQR
jgi:hypothetical protein